MQKNCTNTILLNQIKSSCCLYITNGDNSYLFVNGGEELNFKAKTFDNEMKQNILCLGNLLSDWTPANSRNSGLYGSVYDFAVDYSPVYSVGTIYDIHRYLIKKHDII